MATRGMLPKFRPAQVGNTLARPSIRPVKPTRPPPPPTPPRRRPSGITSKSDRAPDVPNLYEEDDEDVATRVGNFRELDDDPMTQAAVTRPRLGPPETVRYDDETKALRVEEETKALPVDERLLEHARAHHDPYAALPSLEVQRVDDDYEREFAERYPYEAGSDAPTNRNVEYAVGSDDFLESDPEPAPRTARGVDPSGSGARPRIDTAIFEDDRSQETWQMESSVIVNHGSQASQPPMPMIPSIPPPAPVPRDGFIVGVQPIRSGFTPSEPIAMMPMAPTAPPPAYPQPMPTAMPTAAASPRAMHQHHQLQMQMQVAPPPVWQPQQPQQLRMPVAQQVTQPARQGSFRFLWFVVGAVFGIAAFFGASSAAYKYSQQPGFPPAAPLPATATATAATPPAPVAAPAPTTASSADPKPTDAKPSDAKPSDAKPAEPKPVEAKTTATTTPTPPSNNTVKKPVAAAAPPPRTNGRAPRQMYTGSSPTGGDEGGGGGGAASFGGGGAAPKGGNVPSMSGDVFGAALAD